MLACISTHFICMFVGFINMNVKENQIDQQRFVIVFYVIKIMIFTCRTLKQQINENMNE